MTDSTPADAPVPPEAPEPEAPEPAPQVPKGLIGPTLVGMVIGVAVILLLIWLG